MKLLVVSRTQCNFPMLFFTTRSVTYTGQLFCCEINCLLFVLTEFVLSGTQCNPWNLETTGPLTPSESEKYQRSSEKSQRKFSLLLPFSFGMILDNKRCCELGVNDRISFVEKSTLLTSTKTYLCQTVGRICTVHLVVAPPRSVGNVI